MKSIINVLAKMEFMNLWSGRPLRWPFWNIEMSKSKLYHKIFELKDRHRGLIRLREGEGVMMG